MSVHGRDSNAMNRLRQSSHTVFLNPGDSPNRTGESAKLNKKTGTIGKKRK